jgi:hypothetical protein
MTPDLTSATGWAHANSRYLRGELDRLRLLLRRRVLWLRRQWAGAPGTAYAGLAISEAEVDRILEGEDAGLEARFHGESPGAAVVGRALEKLDRDLDDQRQEMTRAGTPPALDVLAHVFALSPLERSVVLLCAAPELDPAFERLYGYVHDDATRKHATAGLAAAVLAVEPDARLAARAALLPDSPLRRYRLIAADAPAGAVASASPLRLDERITGYLLGVNRLDERVAELLQPVPRAPLSSDHRDLVDRLHREVAAVTTARRWPVANLVGPAHSGRRAVAQALCERLSLALYALDVARLPAAGPDRRETLRLLEREALLLRFAVYVDTGDAEGGERREDVPTAVAEQLGLFILLGSHRRWRLERETVAAHLAKPGPAARRDLWRVALDGMAGAAAIDVDALVHQFDFGPTEVQGSVAEARRHRQLRDPDGAGGPSMDDLWQACRAQVGWRMREMAQRLLPAATWEDIVLPADVLAQLREIAAQVGYRVAVYERWGFGARLARGQGISALFSGPSGTGKTMAAEILAGHLRLDLYRIDLAGVVSKYIGETEKNLRRVFDAAEQSGAILFFDEADALFGKRSEVKDSHDRYANIEINYLLQRMEDYRGLAVLATNMKSHLDEAFLRRLRFLVDFPFPDAAHRLRIWKAVFPSQAAVDGLDWDALARLEIPGGNIRNIAVNAAFLAAAAGTSIRMDHVLEASRREYAKIEKLTSPAEFGPYYPRVKR